MFSLSLPTFGTNLKIMAGMLATILLLAGALYGYHKYSSAKMESLQLQIKQQELVIDRQIDTIEFMQKDQQAQQETLEQLQKDFQSARDQVSDLRRKFEQTSAGKPRNFSELAAEKPGLIEKIINSGTANVLKCLELYSGVDINEFNLSEKDQKKLLKECGLSD